MATGGLGYIGSHTCVCLLEKGFNVVIIDSLINCKLDKINKIELISKDIPMNQKGKLFFKKGDIRDLEFLHDVFEEFSKKKLSIKSVIHFAGLKSVEESVNFPIKYWDVNVNGTLRLLSIMEKFECYNLVFSSSATVYKPKLFESLKESDQLGPINPYGNTKLCIERVLKDLFNSNKTKWRIINLRYFNPVGAHASSLIGEDPQLRASNLFPIILNSLREGNAEFYVFGNDWPTEDGTCIRDYIHIQDLADAHTKSLEFLLKNEPQFISLNIGTGQGKSVLDVIKKFNKVNNLKLNYKFVNRREGDAPYVVADSTLAYSLLKWLPKRNIDDMCLDAWNWERNNKA